MDNNLYKKYKKEVVPALQKELGLKNIMQVPKITKVVLNVGVGRFVKDKAMLDNVENTLLKITGQRPIKNKAKKSISNFKIREGMEVGLSVTLRAGKMYDFLEKLISVTLPRVRDFRGIPDKSFDKKGNYAFGFKEHVAFPEIRVDEADKIHGLQVVICTTAKNGEQAKKLLTYLGFPFKK
ncbi:MAG: 50S ribosomal protein L5 [Candidatus Magasanikbacteria bacterium CG10_big_fil_rev_8_21_14_0_10_40_10]|uniref:Large ribosomal subunit protein uL5 n=1 Tax=Candidatus Magasanikbacteria bacterium CG10_big_fil_rev_8_21_14_0_10_40_10 TaxID=1974648 RepID=A0A2M6W597_9BACT|nr:MAG: 50S ribosomal protein L5 [Candidatus Magasanikbacteria bacterium CG10_big_fil_rev_8_21_14_0_10_40_10]